MEDSLVLYPGQYPLASFIWHPKFQESVTSYKFQEWINADMVQFYKLGKGQEMCGKTRIGQLLGDTPRIS